MQLPASNTRILHLSDPHFGTSEPGMTDALRARIQALRPEVIVVSGDLTQRATREQFQSAREFIDSLQPTPVLAVPGNHDLPLFDLVKRWREPYREYQERIGPGFSFESPTLRITGLNSTSPFRISSGRLRLDELRARCPAVARDGRVHLVVFHHPLTARRAFDRIDLLRNRRAALEALGELGIDGVLTGHIHDPIIALSGETGVTCARSMLLLGAGTCLSRRLRFSEANSFFSIDLTSAENSPALEVTRFDLSASREFEPKLSRRFKRNLQGWVRC